MCFDAGLKGLHASGKISGNGSGFRLFMKNKVKILVVDDEIAVASMMVFLLTREGFEVEAALNAEKALLLAVSDEFDLITLDLDMPGIHGFDLFQRLKKLPQLRDTAVIFVSGNASIENQQRALELGAAVFIEKPFGACEFTARIHSLVGTTATA
jgi:DNA-binding response OmpR family regulator